jgi:hypothetical protein
MALAQRTTLIGLMLVGVVVGAVPAAGQIHEDRMDPEELGIGDLDSLFLPPHRYVGNPICRTCHAEAYRVWLGTKHARTFVWMYSEMATMMAEEAGIEAESPAKSAFCLGCHATAADVPAAGRGPEFRMGEGVSCEKCHGPGEAHVQAMEKGMEESVPLNIPTEQQCLNCHRFKPSHTKIPGNGQFSFAERWKKIAHPEDRHE